MSFLSLEFELETELDERSEKLVFMELDVVEDDREAASFSCRLPSRNPKNRLAKNPAMTMKFHSCRPNI